MRTAPHWAGSLNTSFTPSPRALLCPVNAAKGAHMADAGVLDVVVAPTDLDTVVVVRGDLDAVSAPGLRTRVEPYVADTMVLDLSGITFIDSSGVRELLTLRRNVSASGGSLAVRALSERARSVMALLGLLPLFEPLPHLR